MTDGQRFPLYHDRIENPDGADTTQIDLVFQPDGSLKIDGVYAGPKAEEFWGDWDHEFWMDIPASHAQALLALIARDAFVRDGRLTYAGLCDLCKSAEIPFKEGHWT